MGLTRIIICSLKGQRFHLEKYSVDPVPHSESPHGHNFANCFMSFSKLFSPNALGLISFPYSLGFLFISNSLVM